VKLKIYLNNILKIVNKIEKLADIKRKEIGDDLTKVKGMENRPVGMID